MTITRALRCVSILALSVLLAGCSSVFLTLEDGLPIASTSRGCIQTGSVFAAVEVSFRLPGVEGNPFAVELWAVIDRPSGAPVTVPAFFDGGDTWRVRYTPDRRGVHRVSIKRGPIDQLRPASVTGLDRGAFEVDGPSLPGFVRRSLVDPQRFVLDDDSPHFPIGYNVGWSSGGNIPEFEQYHHRLREAGLNWSRHWMAGFAALQLDWHDDLEGARTGRLSLEIARKWDAIVESAEKNGIRFQLVLQHHGQFSTTVAPNWGHCPWNSVRGGFLEEADAYFTSARARELTRLKYRYIVARWGYSTAVMAWELFNEAQFTDAYRNGKTGAVVRWHEEMARYIRSVDPYRHLVTTSSLPTTNPVWLEMDYYQPHAYERDMIAAVSGFETDAKWLKKPIFYGEAGDHEIIADDKADGRYNRSMLWAGLMSGGAGAAQLWSWENMRLLDGEYRAVRRFIDASGLCEKAFDRVRLQSDSLERASISFVPGGGFNSGPMYVAIPVDGNEVEGLGETPAYLHGDLSKRRQGYASHIILDVETEHGTNLSIDIDTVARSGAELSLAVDAGMPATTSWPNSREDRHPEQRVTARIPPGRHFITVSSTGKDWFKVGAYTLTDCAPAVRAVGCLSHDRATACAWAYNWLGIHAETPSPVEGTVSIPGLKQGEYSVTWMSTSDGAVLARDTARCDGIAMLLLKTPRFSRGVAAIACLIPGN